VRLFVAVDVPDRLRDALAAVQSDLPDPSRRTDPADAHLTLAFLGETTAPDAVVDAVRRAVDAAGVAPFDAELGGLGAFPSLDRVRVVWVGVREGAGSLARLAEAVERETVAAGFDASDHEFTPHVTLARVDRADPRVRDLVEGSDPDVGRFRVAAVAVVESTGGDPRYRTVARVPLDG
jgi:2'-5' RNA ligase